MNERNSGTEYIKDYIEGYRERHRKDLTSLLETAEGLSLAHRPSIHFRTDSARNIEKNNSHIVDGDNIDRIDGVSIDVETTRVKTLTCVRALKWLVASQGTELINQLIVTHPELQDAIEITPEIRQTIESTIEERNRVLAETAASVSLYEFTTSEPGGTIDIHHSKLVAKDGSVAARQLRIATNDDYTTTTLAVSEFINKNDSVSNLCVEYTIKPLISEAMLEALKSFERHSSKPEGLVLLIEITEYEALSPKSREPSFSSSTLDLLMERYEAVGAVDELKHTLSKVVEQCQNDKIGRKLSAKNPEMALPDSDDIASYMELVSGFCRHGEA